MCLTGETILTVPHEGVIDSFRLYLSSASRRQLFRNAEMKVDSRRLVSVYWPEH